MEGKDKLFIVMPAYNEEDNIHNVVKGWHKVVESVGEGSRLVIFDDGSKDSTYSILQKIQDSYPFLLPITKPNSGHGATCLAAYNYAIKQGADYVFQTDSDGQTDPNEFWDFWQKRERYDFIIGNRKKREDGLSRVLVTKVLKFVVSLIFGVRISDPNTPFRLMKTDRLLSIINQIPKDFFLSNVAISAFVVIKKEQYLWLPITFKDRQGGVNSINIKRIIKIGWKAIGDLKSLKR